MYFDTYNNNFFFKNKIYLKSNRLIFFSRNFSLLLFFTLTLFYRNILSYSPKKYFDQSMDCLEKFLFHRLPSFINNIIIFH